MADRVRMKSRTVFANDLITVFSEGGPPEGVLGGAVVEGQEFEAGLNLAKDLDRLGHAEPLNRADLEGDASPLEPHYQVSVPSLLADQQRRADAEANERQDGPTIAEYVSAGYPASGYPPRGYASRSSAEEIAAAITAQNAKAETSTQAEVQNTDEETPAGNTGSASEPFDALGEATKTAPDTAEQTETPPAKRRTAASRKA